MPNFTMNTLWILAFKRQCINKIVFYCDIGKTKDKNDRYLS